MNTKTKGDYLEDIVALLETALSANSKTIIEKKYKIKDQDGCLREIDLYVETILNKKTFKYAIECRNYPNSATKMTHIEAFWAKLFRISQDIKGIYVSTGHFQKNAIIKAKALGISLFTVKQNFNNYLNIYDIKYKINISKKVGISPVNDFADYSFFYIGEKLEKVDFNVFTEKYVDSILADFKSRFDEVLKDLSVNEEFAALMMGEIIEYELPVIPPFDVYLKDTSKDDYFKLKSLAFIIEVSLDKKNLCDNPALSYADLETGEIFANIIRSGEMNLDNLDVKMSLVSVPEMESPMLLIEHGNITRK